MLMQRTQMLQVAAEIRATVERALVVNREEPDQDVRNCLYDFAGRMMNAVIQLREGVDDDTGEDVVLF